MSECKYFVAGQCKKGVNCTFLHIVKTQAKLPTTKPKSTTAKPKAVPCKYCDKGVYTDPHASGLARYCGADEMSCNRCNGTGVFIQ